MKYIYAKDNSMTHLASLILKYKMPDAKVIYQNYLNQFSRELDTDDYVVIMGFPFSSKNIDATMDIPAKLTWIDPYTTTNSVKQGLKVNGRSIIVVGTEKTNKFKHLIQSVENFTGIKIISSYEGRNPLPFTQAYRSLEIGDKSQDRNTVLPADFDNFIKFLQSETYKVVSESQTNNDKKTLLIRGDGNQLIPDGVFDHSLHVETMEGYKIKFSSELPHYLYSRKNIDNVDAVVSLYMPVSGKATAKYLILNEQAQDSVTNYLNSIGFETIGVKDDSDYGYMVAHISWESLLSIMLSKN